MADLEKVEIDPDTKLVWLTINGVAAPTPRTFTPVYSDFDSDNSVRNEQGYLMRECIRQGQVAPKFEWRIQTQQLSELLNMCTPTELTVSFYDPKLMAMHEFTGYVQATRQPKLVRQADSFEQCWWDLELSFIEY